MMLTPCWPSAGPTGGAGVAFPAGICNLICPVTFFPLGAATAMFDSSSGSSRSEPRGFLQLLHLQKIQLDRRRASEDRDHHLQRVPVRIDVIHDAGEIAERAVHDFDRLVA